MPPSNNILYIKKGKTVDIMIKGQSLEGAVTLASGRGVKSPPEDIHREITKTQPKCRAGCLTLQQPRTWHHLKSVPSSFSVDK